MAFLHRGFQYAVTGVGHTDEWRWVFHAGFGLPQAPIESGEVVGSYAEAKHAARRAIDQWSDLHSAGAAHQTGLDDGEANIEPPEPSGTSHSQ